MAVEMSWESIKKQRQHIFGGNNDVEKGALETEQHVDELCF